MSIEPTNRVEPSITDVIFGILSDFQKLGSQQLSLLRAEVRSDWDKSKTAVRPMLAGGMLVAVGTILFGVAAALGLHWAFSPAGTDPSRFPLWGCFGVAALVFVGVGLALVEVGAKFFRTFDPMPNETLNALEQNFKTLVESRAKPAQL